MFRHRGAILRELKIPWGWHYGAETRSCVPRNVLNFLIILKCICSSFIILDSLCVYAKDHKNNVRERNGFLMENKIKVNLRNILERSVE
jgi:hypothetical protein